MRPEPDTIIENKGLWGCRDGSVVRSTLAVVGGQHPHGRSVLSVTSVPGYLMPSCRQNTNSYKLRKEGRKEGKRRKEKRKKIKGL